MSVSFSVCIPVWNDVEWLPGAIESALAQTHADWEVIVGDNASDADIGGVVKGFADPRVRYHRFERHCDLYENFNRTVSLANNDWVLMLSSDDRLGPGCLSQMATRIEGAGELDPPLAMVATGCTRVRPDGEQADREFYGHSRVNHIADGFYTAEQWLHAMTVPGQVPWAFASIAFSREVLIQIGAIHPEIGDGAGLDLILRASLYGPVVYIDDPLVTYTVRGNSDSPGRTARNLAVGDPVTNGGAAWLSLLRALTTSGRASEELRGRINGIIARSHIERAVQHRLWAAGRGRIAALQDVWRAFRYSPRLLTSPVHLGASGLAVLAPKWLVSGAMNQLTHHRRNGGRG